jgi:uncharacterized protein YecE (DUF72 family)
VGPALFQLPPFFRKDLALLRDFLGPMPRERRVVLEFRNCSWFDDEVYAALQAHDVALCLADTDDEESPFISTAAWGYVRLRRTQYDDRALHGWAERIATQRWNEAFVYFMDEDEAWGPRFAQRFTEIYGALGKLTDL